MYVKQQLLLYTNINLVGIGCNGVSFEVRTVIWYAMVSIYNRSNRLVISSIMEADTYVLHTVLIRT